MAHGIGVGVSVKTDDRPLSLSLQNREGTVIGAYTMGGLPEWIVEFTDGQEPVVQIIHEKFLHGEDAVDDSLPTAEELLTIASRQFHRAQLLEKGKERNTALTLARIAAEQFTSKIEEYLEKREPTPELVLLDEGWSWKY